MRSRAPSAPQSHDGAAAAADDAERLLQDADATAETLADWLGDRPVLTLLARGARGRRPRWAR